MGARWISTTYARVRLDWVSEGGEDGASRREKKLSGKCNATLRDELLVLDLPRLLVDARGRLCRCRWRRAARLHDHGAGRAGVFAQQSPTRGRDEARPARLWRSGGRGSLAAELGAQRSVPLGHGVALHEDPSGPQRLRARGDARGRRAVLQVGV
ncbi:MAG: hypothetical protein ABEI52_08570 [Halobacteriaceae archaeon]